MSSEYERQLEQQLEAAQKQLATLSGMVRLSFDIIASHDNKDNYEIIELVAEFSLCSRQHGKDSTMWISEYGDPISHMNILCVAHKTPIGWKICSGNFREEGGWKDVQRDLFSANDLVSIQYAMLEQVGMQGFSFTNRLTQKKQPVVSPTAGVDLGSSDVICSPAMLSYNSTFSRANISLEDEVKNKIKEEMELYKKEFEKHSEERIAAAISNWSATKNASEPSDGTK